MARPKGYAEWKPREETLDVLLNVKAVLDEYRSFLPLTVRQIFYRLVGAYGYDKTEKAYNRLAEYLVRARRAQMIPFESIRDDGTSHNSYRWYDSQVNFWEGVRESAELYSRDLLADQPVYVELWCEAGGMVPQMERVANRYSIPVYSTGGFSSVTVTYEIAGRALERDKPTVFLHVGDFDPSGESIFEAMTRDARAFLYNRLVWRLEKENPKVFEDHWTGTSLFPVDELPPDLPDLRPVRVALTADQVEEYELETAPPKATDTRSVNWMGETAQAEAMPPDILADVIEEAILDVLDQDTLDRVREEQETEREALIESVTKTIEEGKNE